MKFLKFFAVIIFGIFSINSFAQSSLKKENIKVWGNCGTCKKKIEKSAKSAGASSASWNEETMILKVSYDPSKSNTEKIEKAIANTGYDTQNFKADDKAYNKLDKCCQYPRKKE